MLPNDPMSALNPLATVVPLIGGVGVDFVANTLTTFAPEEAIREVQAKGALSKDGCLPLLGMLDQMSMSRLEAHRGVLDLAKKVLLSRVSQLDKDRDAHKLELLLTASFPYLGIPELRQIPLLVMDTMHEVPAQFLKQLAEDTQVFKDLPPQVQQQVWEYDKNLLQADAVPVVMSYKLEAATVASALAMDRYLSKKSPESPSVSRKSIRKLSTAVQRLKQMVGTSLKIYSNIIELCVVKFRDSDAAYISLREASYCSLRFQVLMALHDENVRSIFERERCHELAWTLDSCLNSQQITDRHLDLLRRFFDQFSRPPTNMATHSQFHAKVSKRKRSGAEEDAESAGNMSGPQYEPNKVLGDASVLLRDPSVVYLLLSQLLEQLHQAVKDRCQPSSLPRVHLLVELLQLALSSRNMLREHAYYFAMADERVIHEFLPALTCCIVDQMILDKDQDTDQSTASVPQALSRFLPTMELARKAAQMLTLDLLRRDHLAMPAALLSSLAQLLQQPKLLPEIAPFAVSLARRVKQLVVPIQQPAPSNPTHPILGITHRETSTRSRVHPGSRFWTSAVDAFLVPCLDAHNQVHDELLRVLHHAKGNMPVAKLAMYIDALAASCEKVRKRQHRRVEAFGEQQQGGEVKLSDSVRAIYGSMLKLQGLPSSTAFAIKALLR